MPLADFQIISTYTRSQAISDGVLIDITPATAEHGFKLHAVVTSTLYHYYLTPPEGLQGSGGQSLTGRLFPKPKSSIIPPHPSLIKPLRLPIFPAQGYRWLRPNHSIASFLAVERVFMKSKIDDS